MTRLDGNAIGGLLHDAFGQEMTQAVGTCAHCGTTRRLADVAVYLGAGTTMRCPHCQELLMVIARVAGVIVVDAMGFSALQPHL